MPFQYIKNIHSQHIFRILVGGVIIISIGAAIFVAISLTSADDTILYFNPKHKTLAAGDTFWVDIMINAKNDYINAVAAYIAYSPDEVEILQIKPTESVIPLVVEQNIKDGQVEISGGKPTPGFSGKQKIASIQLRMLLNLGADTAVGSIPVVGDFFDFAFKANMKNLRIYRESLSGTRKPLRDWGFIVLVVAILMAMIVLPILGLIYLTQLIFSSLR